MNKAILRNSEIATFDKKNNFAAAGVNFFFLTRWISETDFFSRRPNIDIKYQFSAGLTIKKRQNLVITRGFLYFIFWKENPWTLLMLQIKGLRIKLL